MSVSPSVEAATTTLQNFSLACFGNSLPTLHGTLSLFIKYSRLKCFPHTEGACRLQLSHSPHRLLTQTWSNYRLSRFPLKILHLWRETSLPSKNYTILSNSLLGSRFAQSYQPTILARFEQIFLATGCSTQYLHKSKQQLAVVPINCANLLGS